MTGHSNRWRWQRRWRVYPELMLAEHECGLRVRFSRRGGRLVPTPDNAEEIIAALAPRNGPHNAPIMVQRMVREAEVLMRGAVSTPSPRIREILE